MLVIIWGYLGNLVTIHDYYLKTDRFSTLVSTFVFYMILDVLASRGDPTRIHRATCLHQVGSGSTFAYGVLDTGYSYDLTVEEAQRSNRQRSLWDDLAVPTGYSMVCQVNFIEFLQTAKIVLYSKNLRNTELH